MRFSADKDKLGSQLILLTSFPHSNFISDAKLLETYFEEAVKKLIVSENVRVVAVKDFRTKLKYSHPRLTYIDVDFPESLPGVDPGQFIYFDRGAKYTLALRVIKEKLSPKYIMPFDCDDVLSVNLLKILDSSCPGFFVRKAKVKDESSGQEFQLNPFYKFCGSCHLFRADLLFTSWQRLIQVKVNSGRIHKATIKIDLSKTGRSQASELAEIIEQEDENYTCYILGDHGQKTLDLFQSLGFRFEALDDVVTWRINHGQNHGGYLNPVKDKYLFSKLKPISKIRAPRPANSFPPILHQSWKDSHLPESFKNSSKTWQSLHPSWKYNLWTDQENEEFIKKNYPWALKCYRELPFNICRADLARYFYLFHYGGVYADLDFICLRALDCLLEKTEADIILGRMGRREKFEHSIPNALMISKPGEQFWSFLIDRIIKKLKEIDNTKPPRPEYITGPVVLRSSVIEYSKSSSPSSIEIVPPEVFYPIDWSTLLGKWQRKRLMKQTNPFSALELGRRFPKSYALTYWAQTWADELKQRSA